MSRGAGKIERAIAHLFQTDVDDAYTVEDLAERVYTTAETIEKKHRVAIIRAGKKICQRSPDWTWYIGENRGNTLVFFNLYNTLSYATARLKADMFNFYRHKDKRTNGKDARQIKKMLEPGGSYYGHVRHGGAWWRHVQLRIADRDGIEVPELWAEQEKANRLAGLATSALRASMPKHRSS